MRLTDDPVAHDEHLFISIHQSKSLGFSGFSETDFCHLTRKPSFDNNFCILTLLDSRLIQFFPDFEVWFQQILFELKSIKRLLKEPKVCDYSDFKGKEFI